MLYCKRIVGQETNMYKEIGSGIYTGPDKFSKPHCPGHCPAVRSACCDLCSCLCSRQTLHLFLPTWTAILSTNQSSSEL